MSRTVLFALVFMLAPALAVAQDEGAELGAWGKFKQSLSNSWSSVSGLSLGETYVGFSGFGLGRVDTNALCDYADISRSQSNYVAEDGSTDLQNDRPQGRFAGNYLDNVVTESIPVAVLQSLFTQTTAGESHQITDMDQLDLTGFEEAFVSRTCEDGTKDALKLFAGVDLGRYFKVEAAYVDFGDLKSSIFSDTPDFFNRLPGFKGLQGPKVGESRAAADDVEDDDESLYSLVEGRSIVPLADVAAFVNLDANSETFSLAGMVRQSFKGFTENDSVEIFAKLGVHRWEVEVDVTTAVAIGQPGTTYTLTERYKESQDTLPDGTTNTRGDKRAGVGEATFIGQTITSDSALSFSADGVDLFYGIGVEYRFENGMALRAEWEEYPMSDIDDDLPWADVLQEEELYSGERFNNSLDDSIQLVSLSVLYHF